MDVFKKEDLVLETCEPPEIIEMTESEKAYEAILHRMLFDASGLNGVFTMPKTCCEKCNEEWQKCECKKLKT